MPDEPASNMNVNIGKRVRNYIIYFAVIILFLIWGNDILNLITSSLTTDPQKSEWAQKLMASIITALGAGAIFLLNFGRDIDLHNILDKTFFHVRHKTGVIIQCEMIQAAQKVGANGWNNMENKEREVMYLFYHFVNEQEKLRSLAFTYWEQYFVNIYVICFGLLGFLVSLVIVLFRWRLDVTAFAPLIFLVFVTIVAVSTRYSLLRKIYDLPVQQIREIYSSNGLRLKTEVEARFGTIVIQ